MAAERPKMIAVPVDGSENSLKSLAYTSLMFGPKHNLKVTVFHVLPNLPPVLIEESRKDAKIEEQLKNLKRKNVGMAERLLIDAKNKLVQMGFAEQAVGTVYQERRVGIARDIYDWAEGNRADAVVISTRGRSKLAAFFLGETANKVLEYSRTCPVWLVKGTVKRKHAILAIDNSKNALRAVDHAGFMLSGTDVNVTVFHSKRDLKRFLPKEVADEFPELQQFCQRKAGKVILPFIQKAKDMLMEAGLREDQITTKLVDGSRSAAADILEEMKSSKTGSLFMGLRGYSNVEDFAMGSVTRKVLNHAENTAICIVP
jgi:nucleotide-binding universal stress UspA family protein